MILYPSRGGELARIGPEQVRRRYGVDPNQVPGFIALRGAPRSPNQEPTWASASDFARNWGLNQLADRLDEKVQPP